MAFSDEARPDLAVLLTFSLILIFVLESAIGLVAFLLAYALFYYLNQ